MKIGYDAKRAFHNKTGLGNYSRFLIDAVTAHFPDEDYYLFNPRPSDLYKPVKATKLVLPTNYFYRRFPAIWRSFEVNNLVKQENLDLYHGLSQELPLGGKGKTKWILTVHDLIAIRYPQYFSRIDRSLYTAKLKYACRKADHIVAISKQTRYDLIKLLDIPENKISVVYQDCSEKFKNPVDGNLLNEVRNKYHLPENFLIQVGTIEPRKNLLLSLEALTGLPEYLHLVVVGKGASYLKKIEDFITKKNLEHRVHILNKVQFDELPALYKLARLALYPSFYEGFGIPIIEAIHSGIPVVASTGSCLEEAGGPGALYSSPDSVEHFRKNIHRLLNDQNLYEHTVTEGRKYVRLFEPQVIASQIMNIYQSA